MVEELKHGDGPHNHAQSMYLAQISGPILFTAPHSGKLRRGGISEYGEKQRTHLREKYTAVLAMRFALETELSPGIGGAYCVWDKKHKLNEIDIDPNYLLVGKEGRSPFHRVLHAW